MTTPWHQARIAMSGLWAAIIAAIIIIALAFGAVQTVRLVGFKLWPFEVEGALAERDRARADLRRVKDAQQFAEKEAARQREFWQNHYRNRAQETDLANATETQPRANDDLARYAAANRVQACPAGGASGRAPAAPEGGRAGGDYRSGGVPGVDDRSALREPAGHAPAHLAEQLLPRIAISGAAAEACTLNTARLLDAREWGMTLERDGAVAEPGSAPQQPDYSSVEINKRAKKTTASTTAAPSRTR